MELWHAWTCPYCMRVRVALAEKGLRYDEKEIDLAKKPPELLALNPAGGVPVLVVDGAAIPDSSAILQYLEDRFPEPALLPRDDRARRDAWALHDRVNALLAPCIVKVLRGNAEEKRQAGHALRSAFDALEKEMPDEGYLLGSFSVADIALASFVMKLPDALRPSALGSSRLARWEAAVRLRPSIMANVTVPRPAKATP